MTNEEILNRIEKIKSISKKEIDNPPTNFVLAADGNYILANLYEEYQSLMNEKISKKILSNSEKDKLDQLSYIKDKMDFLQKKAKSSIEAIYIIPSDIGDYMDAMNLYNDLSNELSFILSHDFLSEKQQTEEKQKTDETPDISIDSSISLPKTKKPKIEIEDPKEEYSLKKDLEADNFKHVKKDKPKLEEDLPTEDANSANFKLFQDLADIDRILGNISFDNNQNQEEKQENIQKQVNPTTNNKFYIGSIVTPSDDVAAYNDASVIAKKDSKYRIVSFVALDNADIVVDSSSSIGLSYREFSSTHPTSTILFILSKKPDEDIDIKTWGEREISLDLPYCIGSFSNLSLFSNITE